MLKNKLSNALNEGLPGITAHQELYSYARPSAETVKKLNLNPKLSAVLILLYPHNDTFYFPLIQRPHYDGVHSRQIALPGGRLEKTDVDLAQTALRESQEEIGIMASEVTLLGSLSDIYIPPSNFLVKPFIGTIDYVPEFTPEPQEVDQIITMDLNQLAKKKITHKEIYIRNDDHKTQVACFIQEDHVIWGATAMILNELRHIISTDEFKVRDGQ